MLFKIIIPILFVYINFSNAYALNAPNNDFEWVESHFGLGLWVQDNIRKSNRALFQNRDPKIMPLPLFFFRFGPWFIDRNGGGMGLFYTENIRLMGLINLRGEQYKAFGFATRRQSFFVGGAFKFYAFEFKYYQDLENVSNGNVLKAYFKPKFKHGIYSLSPQYYVERWNKKYTNYYFGVNPDEAVNTGFQAYEAGRAINHGFMLENLWNVNGTRYLFGVGYKYYDDPVRRSPTVDRGKELNVIAGIMHKFY